MSTHLRELFFQHLHLTEVALAVNFPQVVGQLAGGPEGSLLAHPALVPPLVQVDQFYMGQQVAPEDMQWSTLTSKSNK